MLPPVNGANNSTADMDTITLSSTQQRVETSLLIQRAWEAVKSDFKEGLRLARIAHAQAIVEQDKMNLADSLTVMSWANYRLANFDTALENGLEALSIYGRNEQSSLFTQLLGVLGILYFRFSDYSESLRYFHRQETLGNLRQDLHSRADALIGQAVVYSETGDRERALNHQKDALDLLISLGDRFQIVKSYNNICHLLWELGRHSEAADVGYKGIALCENDDSLTFVKAWLLATVSLTCHALGRFAEADSMYQESLQIAQEIEERFLLANLARIKGRFHLAHGEYTEAAACFHDSIEQSKELGAPKHTLELHELLIQLFREQDDTESAMHHYEQVMTLREKMLNESVLAKMRRLEITQRTEVSRKKAELAEAHSAELEHRVAERTAQLEDALKKAEMLGEKLSAALEQESLINEQRSNLIKTVSHAFRTPMTVIRTSSDILKRYNDRLSSEKRDDYFDRITNAINDLSNMLQDATIADSNSVNRVQPNPTLHEFAQLCISLEKTMHEGLANSSNLTFVFDRTSREAVCCDEGLLKQMLFNLLGNAIKFGSDKVVEARLSLERSILHIEIVDQGVGIPPEEIGNLFELFARASNVETEAGLGLGLYVARQIVKAMRGKISAESPGLNLGSTFTVRLPVKP